VAGIGPAVHGDSRVLPEGMRPVSDQTRPVRPGQRRRPCSVRPPAPRRVTMVMTVTVADVSDVMAIAWDAYTSAAGDDLAGPGSWTGCFLTLLGGTSRRWSGCLLDRGDALPYGGGDVRPCPGRGGPRRPLRSPYAPRPAGRTPKSGREGRPPVLPCVLDARREADGLPDSARPCGFTLTSSTI
jgi:hypothetical protein